MEEEKNTLEPVMTQVEERDYDRDLQTYDNLKKTASIARDQVTKYAISMHDWWGISYALLENDHHEYSMTKSMKELEKIQEQLNKEEGEAPS
jgi:hypothetical protein